MHKRNSHTFQKGNIPWNKGLKGYMAGRSTPLEVRIKQSESQIGEKNHNWKGGKTTPAQKRGFRYWLWRDAVITRDKSICAICKRFTMFPIAHHIKHREVFPELQYDVDNGKTLCYDCHRLVHKITYTRKRGEFSEDLKEATLSQAWEEISTKVQRILDETKELYSMSVIPARAPWAKAKIYAEHTGDSMSQEIKNS